MQKKNIYPDIFQQQHQNRQIQTREQQTNLTMSNKKYQRLFDHLQLKLML